MANNIMNITGNGNISIQGNIKQECSECKYYTKQNKFNGKCVRLAIMILEPQPSYFLVRSEFYCNQFEN